MKRLYMTPQTKTVTLRQHTSLLSISGVGSDNGIGFGGVDTEGSVEPDAPGLPDLPLDINPSKLLGFPF